MHVRFFVPGIPKPAGSKRSMIHPKTRKAITLDANKKTKPWQADVKYHASKAMHAKDPVLGPVKLLVSFSFPRPKCHYRTGKKSHLMKDCAPVYHTNAPDLSKLIRAIEDAMIGVVYVDDRQVAETFSLKGYDSKPGASITVMTL